MTTIVIVGDVTVTSTSNGVCITKKGENWGDPWPVADSSISITDVAGLIQALQAVQKQKSWDNW